MAGSELLKPTLHIEVRTRFALYYQEVRRDIMPIEWLLTARAGMPCDQVPDPGGL